mmetsp:Transcript_50429/g.163166  ORF Transcript_50429/g.163166 Transcript_50429/m.163166 type:complete len:277 (+) Transcript_50429:1764-2594(+)
MAGLADALEHLAIRGATPEGAPAHHTTAAGFRGALLRAHVHPGLLSHGDSPGTLQTSAGLVRAVPLLARALASLAIRRTAPTVACPSPSASSTRIPHALSGDFVAFARAAIQLRRVETRAHGEAFVLPGRTHSFGLVELARVTGCGWPRPAGSQSAQRRVFSSPGVGAAAPAVGPVRRIHTRLAIQLLNVILKTTAAIGIDGPGAVAASLGAAGESGGLGWRGPPRRPPAPLHRPGRGRATAECSRASAAQAADQWQPSQRQQRAGSICARRRVGG